MPDQHQQFDGTVTAVIGSDEKEAGIHVVVGWPESILRGLLRIPTQPRGAVLVGDLVSVLIEPEGSPVRAWPTTFQPDVLDAPEIRNVVWSQIIPAGKGEGLWAILHSAAMSTEGTNVVLGGERRIKVKVILSVEQLP